MINLKDSIGLIGPDEVGKNILSGALSRKTGLEVLPIDLFRDMPHLDEFDAEFDYIDKQRENIRQHSKDLSQRSKNIMLSGIDRAFINREVSYMRFQMVQLNRRESDLIKLQDLRIKYPNIPNFKDLGYDEKTDKYYKSKFGDVGSNFYRKQFDVALIRQVYDKVDGPFIINFGAEQAVCLENFYRGISKKEPFIVNNDFPLLEKVSSEATKELFQDVGRIAYVKTPQVQEEKVENDPNEVLTHLFIQSGQYEELATVSVETTNFFTHSIDTYGQIELGKAVIDQSVVKSACNKIISNSQNEDISQ